MVAPFIDLRDEDAEYPIYLVLKRLTTRPTLPAYPVFISKIDILVQKLVNNGNNEKFL
jgi:hypothetical protein